MATINEIMMSHLIGNGMIENQAASVVSEFKSNSVNELMNGRYADDIAGYPDIIKSILILNLNQEALNWIENNIPMAWYKPMFMLPKEREEFLSGR